MNEIDAWLACDRDGTQDFFINGHPLLLPRKIWRAEPPCDHLCETSGHAINPGECRPVRLRVEVVKSET